MQFILCACELIYKVEDLKKCGKRGCIHTLEVVIGVLGELEKQMEQVGMMLVVCA
jgi:hypothetical protein